MQSPVSSQHDQDHDAVQEEEQVTLHALVVVPNPTNPPVRALAPEDANLVCCHRKKKRPAHLDDLTDLNTEKIKRSCKQMSNIDPLKTPDTS